MDSRNQCISTKAKSRRAWTSFAGRGSPVSHIVKPVWPADCSAAGLGEGSPALGSRGGAIGSGRMGSVGKTAAPSCAWRGICDS